MTTRTFAATAAPMPLDTPDRRTMLASAGAAAVLAAIGAPAAAEALADPDAALMALRTPYESTLATMEQLAKPHSRAEVAYFALRLAEPSGDMRDHRKRSGLTIADRHYGRATRANLRVVDRIAAMPARSLAGVVFKAEVSRRESDMEPALLASIVTDLLAMNPATSAGRI